MEIIQALQTILSPEIISALQALKLTNEQEVKLVELGYKALSFVALSAPKVLQYGTSIIADIVEQASETVGYFLKDSTEEEPNATTMNLANYSNQLEEYTKGIEEINQQFQDFLDSVE